MCDNVYIIAEMSANHCGNFELAKKIISAAKDAGADAVKIQTSNVRESLWNFL